MKCPGSNNGLQEQQPLPISPIIASCTLKYLLSCIPAFPAVDDTMRHRYVIFSTPDSREISLMCPIRPGPLSDSQYTVEWIGTDGSTVINRKDYDIKEDIDLSSSLQYQCIVTIQHRSDQDDTTVYNDTITIESLGKLHQCNKLGHCMTAWGILWPLSPMLSITQEGEGPSNPWKTESVFNL